MWIAFTCLLWPETSRGVQTSVDALILSPTGTSTAVVNAVAFEVVVTGHQLRTT